MENNPVVHMNGSESENTDPMEVFNQQLEDIIKTYGFAALLMEQQISSLETQEDLDDKQEEPGGDQEGVSGSAGNDTTHLIKCLDKVKSPEEKVEIILKKYAELLKHQQSEQRKNNVLKKKSDSLMMQKDHLHIELSRALLARTKLEGLCRELQDYNKTLRGEYLQKCHEDESKRKEVTTHFQTTLIDIQAQIDEYSNRNTKLCQENSDLAEKLNNIIHQYEKREESLEKIFKHHDVQQKLADAKLEQANILLKEAEVNHKREKEYLLKEAIEKTKKCYAMKEQELQMKKQLVLYSQKFDEFQVTLGKSNDVYVTFKEEMDKMSKKMKKLEKESDFWKQRFESCNKSLMDLIEERSEKAKEFELFVIKVDKLETLCRALQQERRGLYDKIKSIRYDMTHMDVPEERTLKASEVEMPSGGLGVTAEMEKLKAEQARLQQLAASLTTAASKTDELEDSDDEEESAEGSVKMPPVPEELLEAASLGNVHESDPCQPKLAKEQIKLDGVEKDVLQPLEQGIIQAEDVKTEALAKILPDQLVSSSEAKTEGQGQKQCMEAEPIVLKEAASVTVSSSELEGDANQQEQNTPAQAITVPVPVEAENTKPVVSELKAEKTESKKTQLPKEKPVVEGAAKTEAASQSHAQPETSNTKPQGKKGKKKNQPKNAKK